MKKSSSSSSSSNNNNNTPTTPTNKNHTNDIVRVYIDADPTANSNDPNNANQPAEGTNSDRYKSLSIPPTMTASEVLQQIARKILWAQSERQKYALVMIDQAAFGVRNRRKARTLKKSDLPGKIRLEKIQLMQEEMKTRNKIFDEKVIKEPVKLLLKHTTSPLDLDGDYCGSSADEEDDNTEMNYTISNDTDNYILKGYLYKRGVKDELVWYKRWFVLYHGSLWYWKSRHFQIDPTEIPLANAKLRRSPIAKKNRFMRLAFEIETPRRVYYLRGLTANTNNNLTSKSTKAIEKEHYDNFLKWTTHIENQILLASENCHMQLAEYYLNDHELRASKAETGHVQYVLSNLKLLLQDGAGQQCLRRFMETYNKESLVLFWIDADVYRQRVQTLLHDVPLKRRTSSNTQWKDGLMDLWALAYAIYEQYIDDPKLDIFSKQPQLSRVKLDVHTEPPPTTMFEKLQREVFETMKVESFEAFKEHDESLALLTAMVLKRYANGGKYAGNNNRTTNPFG